jgi:hypothetical protein
MMNCRVSGWLIGPAVVAALAACDDVRRGRVLGEMSRTAADTSLPDTRAVADSAVVVDADVPSDTAPEADAPETQRDTHVAFDVDQGCRTAVGVREGAHVLPQTTLHLIGHDNGATAAYRWSVNAPAGSSSRFFPSDAAADPTFEVNVAGRYEFGLVLFDGSGASSCLASAVVWVVPNADLHVELTWRTPLDLDESDTGPLTGSDVDLHFAHPDARSDYDGDDDNTDDGYFDRWFDVFWDNPDPDWGARDWSIDDNCHLDRDDRDGAGPENLNCNDLEAGRCYRVAVHYWDNHGYGNVHATVRVFFAGALVYEEADVELAEHALWTVTTICWPLDPARPPATIQACAHSTQSCDSDADCPPGMPCGWRIAADYGHPELPPP